jgi:hypothetical protein
MMEEADVLAYSDSSSELSCISSRSFGMSFCLRLDLVRLTGGVFLEYIFGCGRPVFAFLGHDSLSLYFLVSLKKLLINFVCSFFS